jgi:hypothetical protein
VNQWRRVRSPYDTRRVLVADWRGCGFLNRHRQVRLLPGTLDLRTPRDATGVATPLSMGRDRFDSGTRRYLGCRVMVTGRASNTRREGSIPSRPAENGRPDDDFLYLLVLLRPCASCDGLRLRTQHHRVPRMHRPLLDVAASAREQATAPPSRQRGHLDLVLRGRHEVARLRRCLRARHLGR